MKYIETEDILEQVGKRIRELRQSNGLTQADLAKILGKSIKAVQRYESGETDLPLSHLVMIASALNVSLNYLVGFADCDSLEKLDNLGEDSELLSQEIKRFKVNLINKLHCLSATGLTDKSVLMLVQMKKNASSRLRIINLLLEQADSDIDDDYELEGRYEGSVLNAVCRYLEQVADDIIRKKIPGTTHQLILNQVAEALDEIGGQEV